MPHLVIAYVVALLNLHSSGVAMVWAGWAKSRGPPSEGAPSSRQTLKNNFSVTVKLRHLLLIPTMFYCNTPNFGLNAIVLGYSYHLYVATPDKVLLVFIDRARTSGQFGAYQH